MFWSESIMEITLKVKVYRRSWYSVAFWTKSLHLSPERAVIINEYSVMTEHLTNAISLHDILLFRAISAEELKIKNAMSSLKLTEGRKVIYHSLFWNWTYAVKQMYENIISLLCFYLSWNTFFMCSKHRIYVSSHFCTWVLKGDDIRTHHFCFRRRLFGIVLFLLILFVVMQSFAFSFLKEKLCDWAWK